MYLDFEFEELDNSFELEFEQVTEVSDGGFELGYEEAQKEIAPEVDLQGDLLEQVATALETKVSGYERGKKEGFAEALDKRTDLVATANGEYTPSEDSTGFKSVNVNVPFVPIAEKTINFVDLDGTILHAYTVEEAKNLTEMPPLPTRKGLICQEWNWTFGGLKDVISFMETNNLPITTMRIGAIYTTDDGATRLVVEMKNYLTAKLNFKIQGIKSSSGVYAEGTVLVNWGDGNSESVSGRLSQKSISHNYNSAGKYVISIIPQEGVEIYIGKGGSVGNFFGDGTSVSTRYTCAPLIECYVGNGVTVMDGGVFYGCPCLKIVTIPREIKEGSDLNSVFNSTYNLRHVTVPNGVRLNNSFNSCNINTVSLPEKFSFYSNNPFNSVNSLSDLFVSAKENLQIIGANSLKEISAPFANDIRLERCMYSLSEVYFPESVTTISSLSSNNSVLLYDFTRHNSVPALSSSISGANANLKIRVKSIILEEWKNATNWSALADKIVEGDV